jgi:hypothetical protein
LQLILSASLLILLVCAVVILAQFLSLPSIVEGSLEIKLELICGQATFATQSIHMVTYTNLSAERGPGNPLQANDVKFLSCQM